MNSIDYPPTVPIEFQQFVFLVITSYNNLFFTVRFKYYNTRYLETTPL